MSTKGRVILIALLSAALSAAGSVPLPAADREFKAIVDALASHYQKKPMRFMGLLGFIANRSRPDGVKGMKFAIFEDLPPRPQKEIGGIDSLIETAATREKFVPFVRVTSARNQERVFVYARESQNRFELLLITMEEDEAVVMKMQLTPEAMARWIDEPVKKSRQSAHDPGSDRTQ